METRALSNTFPCGTDAPQWFNENEAIDIKERHTLNTGEYCGKIKDVTTFYSKNHQISYVKITLGTRMKFDDGDVVVEMERVYREDYHSDSELVKLLEQLGGIEKHKFYPERIRNLPVKFTIKPNENAEEESRYKVFITDIEVVEKLSEDIDFNYVRVFDYDKVDYVPTMVGAKSSEDKVHRPIIQSPKIEFPEDDDNFLDFD